MVREAALPAVAAVVAAVFFATRRRWVLMALATIVAGMLKPNDALVRLATLRAAMAFYVVGGRDPHEFRRCVPLACALLPLIPPYEHEPDTVLALLQPSKTDR